MEIEQNKDWAGYSYEELRFRNMVVMTRCEIEKAKLLGKFHGASKGKNVSTSVMSKITGALDYFDYMLIAFSVGKKIFRMFRRK